MKPSMASKVSSILISTTLVIAFAIVEAPLRHAGQREMAGVVVRKPVQDVNAKKKLDLIVGKSVIVDSKAEIVSATVADPRFAEAVALDSHELLVNAKVIGETTLTLLQQDGKQRAFDLKVGADLQGGGRAALYQTREVLRASFSPASQHAAHPAAQTRTSFSGVSK